jgi:hypothetical protein
VEFYGLQNWGMPRPMEEDKAKGPGKDHPRMHPLHGETSNIPVREVEIELGAGSLSVSCRIPYFSMEGAGMPWYTRGRHLYDLDRTLLFHTGPDPSIEIREVINNRSSEKLRPDWGYHITFRPEPGSRLLVPSRRVEARGGGAVPEDHETWFPADHGGEREETGILHRELERLPGEKERSRVILVHPDGTGCSMEIPRTPYFQTWFCRGGAGSEEFTLKNGTRIMDRNWDGMGIEIGSSALDHDGNTDPSVPDETFLPPGASREIKLKFSFPEKI